jgi:hypothetical protein
LTKWILSDRIETRKFVRVRGEVMKKFVKVTSNYFKIYKHKGGKPMLAYVWLNPVSGIMMEWFQIFHSEKQRDALFDKLAKQLC